MPSDPNRHTGISAADPVGREVGKDDGDRRDHGIFADGGVRADEARDGLIGQNQQFVDLHLFRRMIDGEGNQKVPDNCFVHGASFVVGKGIVNFEDMPTDDPRAPPTRTSIAPLCSEPPRKYLSREKLHKSNPSHSSKEISPNISKTRPFFVRSIVNLRRDALEVLRILHLALMDEKSYQLPLFLVGQEGSFPFYFLDLHSGKMFGPVL